jgi:murein DD-endopeptidase MepM/ murein hydrolase activator NlpD
MAKSSGVGLLAFLFFIIFTGCTSDPKDDELTSEVVEPELVEEYGFVLNDFNVIRDTVQSGDTFGAILDNYGVTPDKVYEVATKFKDSFDVRRMVAGKPYVLLNSKDSLNTTQVFIYEKTRTDYVVVDFRDSITTYNDQRPVYYVEKEASGVINSSLYETMLDNNLSPLMSDRLASIYAWTVNFFAIQEGDRFRVIYTEKYIKDGVSAGLHDIKAAYFEHKGKPIYAFFYDGEGETVVPDYYDEKADNLRRAFLSAPVKFSRISSRYNLRRRIKYYGNRIRPHKGTDFAANIGTPILATADGTVTKSERRGGNGNYVKIRHNNTYETQYLHMKKRNVRVGDFVRQGDVIGWVGMTGNTSGPHVCYRFWKNGRQVDPFKEDLPKSEPLPERLQPQYFEYIAPIKDQLDCIAF